MDHIGERMAIQNSMKIRRELHSASDLSQASEEDCGAKHLRPWRQVLRVARITNECMRRNAAQKKRRTAIGWKLVEMGSGGRGSLPIRGQEEGIGMGAVKLGRYKSKQVRRANGKVAR
jgi:hypothetical protein